MYFSNGYVYGGEPSPLRKIKSVRVLEKKHLLLCFDNDEKRVFDANILIGPCFSDLDNPKIFEQAYIEHGVVTWQDGKIDCSPEYMYEHSQPYDKTQIA